MLNRNKSMLKVYLSGFTKGLETGANFWIEPKTDCNDIDKKVKNISDSAWYLTGKVFRDTCVEFNKKLKTKNGQ